MTATTRVSRTTGTLSIVEHSIVHKNVLARQVSHCIYIDSLLFQARSKITVARSSIIESELIIRISLSAVL